MCEDINDSIPSHMNFGKYAVDNIIKDKDKVALINGSTGDKMTFGEMAQKIVNTASSLTRRGVKTGDVVAICSENRAEFLITTIAVMCTGATANFINHVYSKSDLLHAIDISKPSYMFLSPNSYETFYETIKSANTVREFFIFGTSVKVPDANNRFTYFNDLAERHIDINSYYPIDLNGVVQTALILYSSGTSGPSKGVKLTHKNLMYSCLHRPYHSGNMTFFGIVSWCNTVGVILTLPLLLRNQTILYMEKFREDLYYHCIQKFKVEFLLTVPSVLVVFSKSDIIRNYDVTSVKLMHCSGAPLEPIIIAEVKKKFSGLKYILQGYGLTETSGLLTQETETEHKEGSVGRVVTGVTIKVVDDQMKMLGPNKTGEICVKGPKLFEGYIGKDLKDNLDQEGFYKTGDLAYYDDDNYFFIVDRLKELIKYKSGQVAPSELEALLVTHEAVNEAGVVGKPDPVVGELPTAFVVKKSGSEVTEQELVDFIASKVSSWKQLRGGVRFVNEIPKTASGKILRRDLRNLL